MGSKISQAQTSITPETSRTPKTEGNAQNLGQQKLSMDRQKLNYFYNFQITEQRLKTVQTINNRKMRRYLLTGIVLGFAGEYLVGHTKIFNNLVHRATIRRLKAKKEEDSQIQRKLQLKNKQLKNK